MELIELNANIRTKTGNGPARVLRREERIPAILYGPGMDPVKLSVPTRDLERGLKKSTSAQPLFNLTVQNGENVTHAVMIKELQTNPISREYLHVDFYKIAMDRKIRVNVPVVTTGKCKGVEMGGLLQIIRHELEVECLPMETPDTIQVDITDLEMGDSIHVEEISLPDGVELQTDVNFTVITVLSPKKETGAAEEEEEGVEEMEAGADAETDEA